MGDCILGKFVYLFVHQIKVGKSSTTLRGEKTQTQIIKQVRR